MLRHRVWGFSTKRRLNAAPPVHMTTAQRHRQVWLNRTQASRDAKTVAAQQAEHLSEIPEGEEETHSEAQSQSQARGAVRSNPSSECTSSSSSSDDGVRSVPLPPVQTRSWAPELGPRMVPSQPSSGALTYGHYTTSFR